MMPIQQQSPARMGFPPVRMSLTIFVFRPIAAIAMIIKNLLSDLKGVKISGEAPRDTAAVVMTEAPAKARIKYGKTFRRFVFCAVVPAFFVRKNARNRVIGIIARVRVSLTVTALSRVAFPRP